MVYSLSQYKVWKESPPRKENSRCVVQEGANRKCRRKRGVAGRVWKEQREQGERNKKGLWEGRAWNSRP
jgi:hypothetical protein